MVVCGGVAMCAVPEQNLPATSAVVAALIGWNLVYCGLLAGRDRALVAADVAVICAVCMSQPWTVPPEALADFGSSWVYAVVQVTVVTYQWHAGPASATVASLLVVVAYGVGGALPVSTTVEQFVPVGGWLLVDAALARGLFVLVRRGGRRADAIRARGERMRQEAAVSAAKRTDNREHLAALHDTAAATLLMVGMGAVGGRELWLSEQAARDLRVLSGRTEVSADEVDLIEMLRPLERSSRLRIEWTARSTLPAPYGPAAAICQSVRETLTNVRRYAGVDTAAVRAERQGARIVVEVADTGRGFDPATVPPHRYGVSGSIIERMDRAGGRASVLSGSGRGTVVRLEWPAAELSPPPPGAEPAAKAGEVTAASFLRGLRLAVFGITVAVLVLLYVPQVAAHAPVYRPLAVEIGAYLALGAVAAWCGALVAREEPFDRWRWPLLAVVFAASAAATAAIPAPHLMGSAHGVYGVVGWFAVLLLMGCPMSRLLAVLIAHHTLTAAQVVFAGQADADTFTAMAMKGVVDFALQALAGYSAVGLRRIAEYAARYAAEEERLRVDHAISEGLARGRRARYATLARTVLPMLAGLASGTHDPADVNVRRVCAIEAARLRRLFAEDDDVPDPLVHELQACISIAERNGVDVSLAIRGRRPALPNEVRRALTEPALAALATAGSVARVAVVACPTAVTVSVVADAPLLQLPSVAKQQEESHEVTVTRMAQRERLWVEATWRAGD